MTDRVSIGAAARRAGLTPAVIRMWEARYGAVTPSRTATGQRRYSDADVRRLELLGALTEAGHRIGLIASSSDEELERRALESSRPAVRVLPGRSSAEVDVAVDALRRLDRESFRRALEEAPARLGRVEALDRFFAPLMREIGDRCATGDLSMVHEHLATAEVRGSLDAVAGAFPPSPGAPRIMVGTPAWQFHELGALLVAASARSEGWSVTFLGPNLPASELAVGAIEGKAAAVALSVTYVDDRERLISELRSLASLLPEDVALIVGGRGALDVSSVLEEVGAQQLQNLSDFRFELDRFRKARLAG